MEKAEWKKEIDALLSSGTITDSDIEDYISKHPEIRGRDVWYYISELTAPEECKGCVHIQMSGIYPCNVCKRRNILSDYYKESAASHNSQLISHSAVNGRVVRPGQIYRHFKGNIVRVLQVAQNSELPGQYSVVYECGNSKTVWCRPYDMFLSEVDHEKYPNVTQKYRFELVKE